MPSENRTRVEIFLPVGSDPTAHATITEWLAEEMTFARGGATVTTPFVGYYLSATGNNLIRDAVRVLFCDFDLDVGNTHHVSPLESYIDELRSMLLNVLEQEEVWNNLLPSYQGVVGWSGYCSA